MGYESLIAIYDEARDLAAEEYRQPHECPNDGTVLITKEDGTVFCRFDGWIWNGTMNGNEV